MVQVWRSYVSDLGRAYPMFALSVEQLNDVGTTQNAIALLPPSILTNLLEVNNPCGVDGLTPRSLFIYASDGALFSISYPLPFTQALFDYLTVNSAVAAFEFVGERLKYGRLRRLLENV